VNYNPLQLTANNLVITVYGEMDTYWGTNNINTMISRGGPANANDYIDVSGGTLAYYGRQNITDMITVPIAVHGGGTLKVTVDPNSGKPLQGKLIVQFSNASTNNVSVYLAGSQSSVQLSNYDTLECDNGYRQDSGTLETMDSTSCSLQAGAGAVGAGTVTIAGGAVIINQPNTGGYGTLNVSAATLNSNGQLVVAMDASKPNQQGNCDLLNVSGTTNLGAASTLIVYVNNGPPQTNNNNNKWIIIQDGGGNITGNFAMPITTVPQTNNLTPTVNNKQYILTS